MPVSQITPPLQIALLTSAICRLTLKRQYLDFFFVRLHVQVGQVLLHLPRHLGVLVQLLGVQKRAAPGPFFVRASLHIQHVRVRAALAQRSTTEKSKAVNVQFSAAELQQHPPKQINTSIFS